MSNVVNLAEVRTVRQERAQAEAAIVADLEWVPVYRHVAALLYSYYVAIGETAKARKLGESFINDLSTQVRLPGSLAPDLDQVLGVPNYIKAIKKVREYADREEA